MSDPPSVPSISRKLFLKICRMSRTDRCRAEMPIPTQKEASIIEFKIGRAKVPGETEPVDAIVTFHPAKTVTETDTDQEATVNEAADVLIQKQMVKIGYVYTGWSKDRVSLAKAWNKWLSEVGLLDTKLDLEVRKACLHRIQSRVDYFSAEWKKLGHWGIEGKEFCAYCKGLESEEDCAIKFTTWITQQTQSDEWDGEFTVVSRLCRPDTTSRY